MRNNKGYLLLDSMFAGLVLVILCVGVLPLITQIYVERLVLSHEETALEQLKMAVVSYEESGEIKTPIINISGQHYEVHDYVTPQNISICVSWNAKKNQPFEKCVNVYVEK